MNKTKIDFNMETCNNCGKPLILNGGKCIYCGSDPSMQHSQFNQDSKGVVSNNSSNNMSKRKNNRQERQVKGKRRKSSRSNSGRIIRLLLLLVLIAETILVSIAEVGIHKPWGFGTIMLVNFPSIALACEQMFMAKESLYEHDKKGWRLYHEYFHFIVKMIGVLVGLCVISRFQNLWTLILDLLLSLSIVFVDTMLEDILE